jgi:multidrug efflux pump subunit AcrA (membrane-fusion protein)
MKTFIHKFLLLAVLPATLAGCGGAAKTDEPKKESVRVKVAEVEYTDFAQPILASGTLVSDKEARLSFKTGGIIAELLVDVVATEVIEPWGGGKWHLEVFRSATAEPEDWNGEM